MRRHIDQAQRNEFLASFGTDDQLGDDGERYLAELAANGPRLTDEARALLSERAATG